MAEQICEHGTVRRQCETCEWKDEAERLRAEVEALRSARVTSATTVTIGDLYDAGYLDTDKEEGRSER